MYDVDVSPDLISRVTDAVLEGLQEWQSRPLDRVYQVVFVDALMGKIRDGVVANRLERSGSSSVVGLLFDEPYDRRGRGQLVRAGRSGSNAGAQVLTDYGIDGGDAIDRGVDGFAYGDAGPLVAGSAGSKAARLVRLRLRVGR